MATPKPERSDPVESPTRTELAITAPASSCARPALASITGGDAHGAVCGLESDGVGGGRAAAEMSPTSQASHEALPADIDVSWRKGRYGNDGEAVASSAKHFSDTVRLRSSGSRNDAKRASSRVSPPYYSIPSNTAAGTPTALGTSGRSSPDEAILERREDARTQKSATAAHLFASIFSALGEGRQVARRSPTALDGGASRSGGRSPMSARVDVLQNLLAPAGDQDLPRPNLGVVTSAVSKESTSDGTIVAKMSMAPGAAEKGGGGGRGIVECDEIVRNAERLLGRSSENGSQNTNAVGSCVDAIARHQKTQPGLSNERKGRQQAEAAVHPQTPETRGTDLRPTRTRARSGVESSASALDSGPEGTAAPLGPSDEFDAMERIQFDDVKGLSRPASYTTRTEERWDEQEAGPRPTIGERSDELEELEVSKAMPACHHIAP